MRIVIAVSGLAAALLTAPLCHAQTEAAAACASGSLALNAALSQAAQNNPSILLAREGRDAAAAGQQIAAERPNPTLNAGITQWDPRARSRADGAYNQPLYASVQLQQLIERGGKRDARLAGANAGAAAADADLADTQRRVTAQVQAAYYTLKLADARADALQGIADLQDQTLVAADRRLKVGDLSKVDRGRIALEALKARSEQQQAQADATTARLALGALLGCRADDALQADDDWLSPQPIAAVASARADEVADQQRLRAAEAALKLSQAQRSRDVTLGIEWDHDPRVAPNMAGITVGVPLFIAHRYEGEIAQARAQLELARTTAAQTALQADTDRASSAATLAAAQARRERAVNEVLPQAESAADAVEYAYAHGAAPLLDLLDARRGLRAARLDALSAQFDLSIAVAARAAAIAPYRPAGEPAASPASPSTNSNSTQASLR